MVSSTIPATPALPLSPGQLVGNYRVLQPLGMGGMGAVLEPAQKDMARRAAIKPPPRHFAQHPQIVARFLNEARAVNLARHPGLVEIYEFGLLPDGTPFLVMEYLEGQLLRHRIHS